MPSKHNKTLSDVIGYKMRYEDRQDKMEMAAGIPCVNVCIGQGMGINSPPSVRGEGGGRGIPSLCEWGPHICISLRTYFRVILEKISG